MDEIEELKRQYQEKVIAARAKANSFDAKSMPKEVSDEINAMLGEADQIKARLDLVERLNAGEQVLREPEGTKAAHLGWREAGPDEGNVDYDEKSWREVEYDSVRLDPIYGMPMQIKQRVRFNVPRAVEQKGYAPAFEAYLRKGRNNLGPNDLKVLTEGVDSAGGYLVPEDYHVELIRKMAAVSTIRPNARVVPTSRDMGTWPKVHYTADDKYTSPVRLTWTGESPATATVHRVTDTVYGLYTIPVHTAMASWPISNDFLEDSAFDVFSISTDMLAEAFALGENDVFLNGDGVGKPMGILAQVDQPDGPVSVKSGDAAKLTGDGVIDLVYALPGQYDRNAKIYMAKSTEREVRKLKAASTGDYLWPILPSVGNMGPVGRELLGYPVVREEFLPAVGAGAFPILVGDLTGYIILDRVGFSLQRLTELYAETNLTLLLARKRVGGQLAEPWKVKVQKVSA